MKIAYISLGCPKNDVDLEGILGGIASEIEIADNPFDAQAAIVNTCAFIESAKQESIDTILELAQIKQSDPGYKILVAGCLPQRYREELSELLPEVDAFFNSVDSRLTAKQIAEFWGVCNSAESSRWRITPRHYAYLKIAEGCDNRCSYCAIPLIKGRSRSRPFNEIIDEAHKLAADGARELIIVAQDTTLYGKDLTEDKTLIDLLETLNNIKELRWIRLLYTHPHHWTRELIEAFANLEKLTKYVDLPIQHISDEILKRMGRRVKQKEITNLIDQLRQSIPDVAIRTSLIVGFPGESEHAFSELLKFIEDVEFDRLGAFTYSKEEDTQAYGWQDDLTAEEKQTRYTAILEAQSKISAARNHSLVGQTMTILIDEWDNFEQIAVGRTQWDAPEIDNSVKIAQTLEPGAFVQAEIIASGTYDLAGIVI